MAVARSWDQKGARAVVRARDTSAFIEQYASPLFYRRTRALEGDHQVFGNERDFWGRSPSLSLASVSLENFRLSDWFPRTPGVYWSDHGRRVRDEVDSYRTQSDPDLGLIFNPRSKMALIEQGGIGTIRLRHRAIDGEDCWFATAVRGRECSGGIPLAIPHAFIREAKVSWGDTVRLRGTVRALEDAGLDDTAAYVHHAAPIIIFVEEIEGLARKGRNSEPIVITPVVLFGDRDSESEQRMRPDWGGD
jgi:hypothetical protein